VFRKKINNARNVIRQYPTGNYFLNRTDAVVRTKRSIADSTAHFTMCTDLQKCLCLDSFLSCLSLSHVRVKAVKTWAVSFISLLHSAKQYLKHITCLLRQWQLREKLSFSWVVLISQNVKEKDSNHRWFRLYSLFVLLNKQELIRENVAQRLWMSMSVCFLLPYEHKKEWKATLCFLSHFWPASHVVVYNRTKTHRAI